MFDLKVRAASELASVPIPLPGRVMLFASESGLMTRHPDGTLKTGAHNAPSQSGALLRGVAQAIDPSLSGVRQVFGRIDLASVDGQKTLIEVIAPLLARLDSNSTSTGCDVDLFLRVDGGDWVWWDAYDLTRSTPGDWVTVQITARFFISEGHLCSLVNSTKRIAISGGLIEWSAKLQHAVGEVRAIAALVAVS